MTETNTVASGDGEVLAYSEWGDRSGSPMFFLHGSPGSRFLRSVGGEYERLAIHAITYDRPGYGRSTRRRDRRVRDAADDVQRIADDLGLSTFAVVGVSAGGPHALAVAAALPERVTRCATIVGLAPFDAADLDYFDGMSPETVEEWNMPDEEQNGPAVYRDTMAWIDELRSNLDLPDRTRDMLVAAFVEALAAGPGGMYDDNVALSRPWGVDLSVIRCPVTIMAGADDDTVPLGHGRWLAAHIRSAKLVTVPGGHIANRDAEEENSSPGRSKRTSRCTLHLMTELSPDEARVLGSLDEAALVASLVDLVRIPSITGTSAESDLQHRQAAELTRYGFDVDTWQFDLEKLRSDPRFPGTEADRAEGYGVVATVAGKTGTSSPALVLQGHVDVVPTGDLGKWVDQDPFSGAMSDGILHGRGACDMKAGLAANMAVARTLNASGITLETTFAVHAVVSEEDGGLGAFATMLRGYTGDAAVITEPTSGRIVTANAGALTFAVTVPGRAAHGSMRLEGVNALDAFLPIYRRLRDLETERNAHPDRLFGDLVLPYPISVGRVTAGDWASSVPDICVAEGRMGVQLGEDPAVARAAFEAAVEAAGASDPWLSDNPAVVTWPGGQFASGRLRDDHPLIDEVAMSITDLSGGSGPARSAAPYGSDLRLYAGIGGIPSLHYGPGDVRFAHAPREQVELAEVIRVTRALLLLTVRRCGGHF